MPADPKPAAKKASFALPEGAAVERFRARVDASVAALLPGPTPLADSVVAGYLLESVIKAMKARLFDVNARIEEARSQAATDSMRFPTIPTVVGMVRRKVDYIDGHMGDLVGEVTRAYAGLQTIIYPEVAEPQGSVMEKPEPKA
jgi:hypothetical protein